MEMVMFRTSFVFIMFWLLLITLPKSHSQPTPPFSDCKEQPYECGTLTDIFYPFWGNDRLFQCGGGQPFKLNCHGDTTTIQIASQNFTVKDIKMKEKTMRLVPTNLANLNVCSLKSEDINVNSTQILYRGFRVYDITIFYDCHDVNVFTKYYFTCGRDSYSYYVIDNDDNEKLIKQLSPLCKGRLHVPADAVPDDYAAGGDATLEKVLQKGFEVNFNVAQDCARCLGREGDCWRNILLSHFWFSFLL